MSKALQNAEMQKKLYEEKSMQSGGETFEEENLQHCREEISEYEKKLV